MNDRPLLSIAECVGIVHKAQNETGIECKRYGIYDKEFGRFRSSTEVGINVKYTHSINTGFVEHLKNHNGQIYFPALIKGRQLAFLAVFDTVKLYEKYGKPVAKNIAKGQIDLETYMKSLEEAV